MGSGTFSKTKWFYWLNYFFSNSDFDSLKSLINFKYQEILQADPNLPKSSLFNFYGIIFDLPLALIETLLKIDSSKTYFEIRHLTNFIIFFISSIYFYKIITKRFKNNYTIFLGLCFYIFSPRIFGDSFFNNKDILFLSILVITIYYLFELFKNQNNKNLVLFCLFSALASSSRIMGIYLPLMLIILNFFEYINGHFTLKNFIFKTLKILTIFYFFLLLHYPYAWELNFFEIKKWFKSFFYSMDIEVLFNGIYYSIKYLPRAYLPTWIAITTPIFIIILFLLGVFLTFRIIFKRIINIDIDNVKSNNKKINDLWNSTNEKKDLFVFISFFSFFFYAIFLNVAMLSGWRHFYFLHIFIIYFSIIGMDYIFYKLNNVFKLRIFYLVSLFIFANLLYINFKLHPYQSLYFSNIINANMVSKFQVDTPNLSRSDALKYILKTEKNKKKIFIANSSWTPMYNGKDMLIDSDQKKLIFVGQEYAQADYIYTNYVYKSDEKYNKNFKVPKNFDKIMDYKVNNLLIYSIYKKKNLYENIRL